MAGLELAELQQVRGIAAPAGSFRLMGLSSVRGRDFNAAERSPTRGPAGGIDAGAIIIGSGLARRLWGGTDPIGRRREQERESARPASGIDRGDTARGVEAIPKSRLAGGARLR